MKRASLVFGTAAVLSVVAFLAGCKKDENVNKNGETLPADVRSKMLQQNAQAGKRTP